MSNDDESLTARDHTANLVRMLLGSVPVAGPLLDRGIFGVLDERRMKRVETTLAEIALRVNRMTRETYVHAEHFQAAIETLVPAIAKASNETKRRMLRDLLLHAVVTPPDDPLLDEAELAMRLVQEIDPPGLALIGAAAVLDAQQMLVRTDGPVFAWAPEGAQAPYELPPPDEPRVPLPYSPAVLAEWSRRMNPEGLCVFSGMSSSAVGFLTTPLPNAQLIARWAIWSDADDQPPRG